MINDPLTVSPDVTLADLDKLCGRFHISGLPVVDNDNKLVGIITNRDMRFIASEDYDRLKVSEVMTRENLITRPTSPRKTPTTCWPSTRSRSCRWLTMKATSPA
jgi:IMP dehydrogenase